ncbi:MAG: RraA family protein [Candidatus Poribacteria bacterium]|nr:RraA family protein [Candidatus Poribacteria bacterium]
MITYDELMQERRMRFAASIINSAYASDSLDRLGIQTPGGAHYYLPLDIRYLCGSEQVPSRRLFGVAHTADFRVVQNPHDPEYQANPYAGEVSLIRTIQPGDVLVVNTPTGEAYNSNDENERKNGGVWGGLLTAISMSYGSLGAVINGPIRDTNQIDGYFRDEKFDKRSRRSLKAALGKEADDRDLRKVRRALLKRGSFPVFGTGTAPTDSAYRTEAHRVGEPIQIGGVTIHDRDFIVADNDGQVVGPNGAIRDVLETVIQIDESDKGVWADALARMAGVHDDSIDAILERHGGHL